MSMRDRYGSRCLTIHESNDEVRVKHPLGVCGVRWTPGCTPTEPAGETSIPYESRVPRGYILIQRTFKIL